MDGTSSTLLLSENLRAGDWTQAGIKTSFVWLYARDSDLIPAPSVPCPRSVPETPVPLVAQFNSKSDAAAEPIAHLARPSSRHPGGVMVAFVDGHTRFLSDGIPYVIYQHLMTPNGSTSDHFQQKYLLVENDFD